MTQKTHRKVGVKTWIFYIAFLVWPLLQFAVFYIAVNFNSILLAFKNISIKDNTQWSWTFDNFTTWFQGPKFTNLKNAMWVSLKAYFFGLIIGVPIGLIFSYYIFKRLPGSMFFRFILYLPSILSAMVCVLIYKYFCMDVINKFAEEVMGKTIGSEWFAKTGRVSFAALMFFNIFIGFGTTVLLYANKMSSISPDLIDASALDGVNTVQEFFHIVMPEVYSTLSVFLITGIAGICINQLNAYPLLNGDYQVDIVTVGYYMYDMVYDSGANIAKLTDVAALGIMLSALVIPLTFLVRYLLLKFGPSED